MNTRLQVEHPVTELAHGGIDLVQLQLEVASGAPLRLVQADLVPVAHSIEARVYAEDSHHGFLPQAGRASSVHWPERRGAVRVDHALEGGQVVSTSYDPMLGKVIASGPDRESARQALLAALDDTAILGLTTNAGFLRQLVACDDFRDATIDTAWLDHLLVAAPDATVPRLLAAHAIAEALVTSASGAFGHDGWRASGLSAPVLVDLDVEVPVEVGGGTRVEGRTVRTVAREAVADGVDRLLVDVDGERHVVFVAARPHEVEVVHQGQRHVFTPPDPFAGGSGQLAVGEVVAPMPGTVLVVEVAEGEAVTAGQALGMMEAMKMELALAAPYDGVVTSVAAAVGQQVALGDQLFVVEPA